MEVALALLESRVGLILTALVGGLLASRVLKISPLIGLAAASLPLFLPQTGIPAIKELSQKSPELLYGGTWGVCLLLGGLWFIIRPVVSALAGTFGLFRFGHLVALSAALVVVVLLYVDPGTLSRCLPNWRKTIGGLLLLASLVSVSKAFGKIVKAGLVLSIWSCVSVVLASQIFLHKMPHAVEMEDLAQLNSVMSADGARQVFDVLQRVVNVGRASGEMLGLSGSAFFKRAASHSDDLSGHLLYPLGLRGKRATSDEPPRVEEQFT